MIIIVAHFRPLVKALERHLLNEREYISLQLFLIVFSLYLSLADFITCMRATEWNIVHIEIFDRNLIFENIVVFKDIYCIPYTTKESIMYDYPKYSFHIVGVVLDTPHYIKH